MNTVQKYAAKQAAKLQESINIPEFSPGDTVKVNVKVREGTRERVQAYEGVCIARSNDGINSSFTVRKISYGEGVERVFPLFSPRIESVELVRRGSVRRAKLYYLRGRRGKSARISERTTGHGIETKEEQAAARAEAKKLKAEAKKEAKAKKAANKKDKAAGKGKKEPKAKKAEPKSAEE